MEEERFRFLAEWFDTSVKVKREFILSYFPSDGAVEMYDRRLKRLFLKRMLCDNVDINDIYVGGVVNVLSRQLFITGFGDKFTESKFTRDAESTVLVVKMSGFQKLGKIIDIIQQNDLSFSRGRMVKLEGNRYKNSSFYSSLGPNFAVFEVRGENAIAVNMKLLGMDNTASNPLKAELGLLIPNCMTPSSVKLVNVELDIFFPLRDVLLHCNTARFVNSTCCIIKPHAVRENTYGKIMQEIINSGFQITALKFLNFDLDTASEFLEVYKGVVATYTEMVSQLISGTCIALEICNDNVSNTAEEFRALVGPEDPQIASKLRPNTLRAFYGHDRIKNAVHCTDLAEDARIEVEYIFRIINANT